MRHEADPVEGTAANHRPVLAAALSAVVPGAGQWYAGRVRRALLLGLPLVVLVVVTIIVGRQGAVRLLRSLVQPSVLWALIAINLALLAWRLFAVVDAYRVAGGKATRAVAVGILVRKSARTAHCAGTWPYESEAKSGMHGSVQGRGYRPSGGDYSC